MTPYDHLSRAQLIERLSFAEKTIKELADLSVATNPVSLRLDTESIPMADVDRNGVIVSINSVLTKINGFPEEEIVGRRIADFGVGDDLLWDEMILQKMLNGEGDLFMGEHDLITKSGETMTFDVTVTAIRDENGGLLGATYVFSDICEEKKKEKELADMLDTQKRITDVLLLMIQNETGSYEEDILKIILQRYSADRAYIFRFDWENGFSRNTSEVVAPGISRELDNLQHVRNCDVAEPIACFRRGEPFLLSRLSEKKEGSLDWDIDILSAQNIKSIILFPLSINGELWGYLGLDMVVGEKIWSQKEIDWLKSFASIIGIGLGQKLTMDKLDRQRELLNLILDSGGLVYWKINTRTREVECSANYYHLLGYEDTNETFDISEFWSVVHPDDLSAVREFSTSALADRTTDRTLEFRFLKKDGSVYWVLSKLLKLERDPYYGTDIITGLNINIDRVKKASQAVEEKDAQLRQSELQYSDLFREMSIGYAHNRIICDETGRVVDVLYLDMNAVCEQLMGITREKLIGRTATEYGHKFSPGLLELFSDVALNGVSRHYEYYSEQLRGWFSMSAYSPKEGEFVLFLNDITTRHKAHEAIKWNERKLRTIFDNIPVGIALYDHAGDCMESNAFMIQAFNTTQEHLVQWNILKFIESRDQAWDGKGVLSMEFAFDLKENKVYDRVKLADENVIYLLMKVIPLYGDAASSRSYMAIVIDETENYTMQHSLIESRETQRVTNAILSSVLELSQVLPWDCNVETQLFSCDHNLSHHERQPDPIDGKYYCSLDAYIKAIHPESREHMSEVLTEMMSGRRTSYQEVYQVHWFNDREYEWVDDQGVVFEYNEQGVPKRLIGSMVIITERKNMEQKVLDALEQAEQSNRLKSAFLANMSHEIRTPLNAIVGFSEIITTTEDPREREEYAQIIANNNQLLLQLISDILDISKIEAGTLDFVYSSVDLNVLLQDVERAAMLKVDSDMVRVSFAESLPNCVIYCERNRLLQVINNLMTNALKFTEKGTITFGYRVVDENMLYFYMTDTGCGIDAKDLQNVFGRFVKLNSFVQGTGLGLSICETIIHNLGGQIGVESELGVGSTFWFTIPYRKVENESEVVAQKSGEKGELVRGPLKPQILIAEDNDSNYFLFKSILKKKYTLIRAYNGLEVVDMFSEVRPDLILMDIKMPELNGIDATAIIREVSSSIPIIAVTAFAYDADREKALAVGCNDFITKPISSKELLTIIEKYLN